MKLGNATIHLSCEEYDAARDVGAEEVGFGSVEIRARDYLRVWKNNRFDRYSVDVDAVAAEFKEDKEATVHLDNDDLIVFLNAIMTEPRRTYHFDFIGLSYWFWHDVTHAMNDVQGGSVYVDAHSENRALYLGAKLALEQGVSLAQIVRELAKAEVAYEKRFNGPAGALDKFLQGVEVVSK